MVIPLIDLSLQGGICTIFAYGQTGSGKTYTIQGIMTRIGDDLFRRQQKNHMNDDSTSCIQIKAKFVQILGSDVTDLLNDHHPVLVGENKFGKVEITAA